MSAIDQCTTTSQSLSLPLPPFTKPKLVILHGILDNIQIQKSSFPGIALQVCMPDIMRRRFTKAIDQVRIEYSTSQTNSTTEKQNQLQYVLESFYREFALLRDISNVMFICICLAPDTLEIIQMIYPPSELIKYKIIPTQDLVLDTYPEYFKKCSPASSAASSTSTSPSPFPALHPNPILDNRISRIPLSSPGTERVIYLGSDAGANDFASLSSLGITHILNITDCIPNYYEDSSSIVYMRVPIPDCGSIILKDYFPAVFEFISNALDTGGQILVHCFAGKSRSASFVIAYLMQHKLMSYMDAFRHVQTHRPVVEPNFGFELQLHAFEEELQSNHATHCDTTTGDE